MTGVDYDQNGMPQSLLAGGSEWESERQCRWCGERRGSADHGQRAGDDTQSFMDRSNDIALAVRDAMLNLNSINDVVNDL